MDALLKKFTDEMIEMACDADAYVTNETAAMMRQRMTVEQAEMFGVED